MPRRDPREARALGLWTAGWLFALLLAGLLWIGDLRVQWPVLAVPVLWALVALRPRRRDPGRAAPPREARSWEARSWEASSWEARPWGEPPRGVPPTREMPASRPRPRPPDTGWG